MTWRFLIPVIGATLAMAVAADPAAPKGFDAMQPAIQNALTNSQTLPAERKELLDSVARLSAERIAQGEPVRFVFICTHNSRRSHFGEAWGRVAAAHFGLSDLEMFSGGTEVTACNIRTVNSLRRVGFSVVQTTTDSNPVYLVQFADGLAPYQAYSKRYDDPSHPQAGLIAMMCCADADESCPVVPGAVQRVPLHYIDPKASDGTPAEAETYDARSLQVASEMFYLMGRIAELGQ